MSWQRKVYWLHKWSAALAVALALIWFASGIAMTLPPSTSPRLVSLRKADVSKFRDIKISVPQAIAGLEAELGRPLTVRQVTFRIVGGRLFYQMETAENGSHLIDVEDGKRLVIDQETAVRLLATVLPDSTPVRVTLIGPQEFLSPFGPLSAYRIETAESSGVAYYVAVETGEIRATPPAWVVLRFLRRAHTLDFLRPLVGDRVVRLTLFFFSIVGTLMTLFGMGILWIQFMHWRRPTH